jgi:alkylated DNA repair dioxygenase AlkB
VKFLKNKIMRPIYEAKYAGDIFDKLLSEVAWANKEAPRDECFMSPVPLEYTYGKGFTRTYKSMDMHPAVQAIMDRLNADYGTEYNVCFLNYYKSDKEHLGWHADDSPEMDPTHPIAVVSFGAERYIWTKMKGIKGDIPDEDKFLLENGSLFIMPAGYQKDHVHKIPKHDRVCGGRISLTFRKYVEPE